ncbi:bacteriocin [Enterococcus ratti]|uniref:bacteriocin n=1 Tax=Enterococcus ratti TaxID=150033 RepID=UPI003516FA0A
MKKIIMTTLLISGMAVLLVVPMANAAQSSFYSSGQENVDGYTTVVETQDRKDEISPRYDSSAVGGGWWRRGKSGNRNISEYQHYTKKGHASCENGNGTFNDGGWKDPNQWSKSSVGWTLMGGNKAYYNYR